MRFLCLLNESAPVCESPRGLHEPVTLSDRRRSSLVLLMGAGLLALTVCGCGATGLVRAASTNSSTPTPTPTPAPSEPVPTPTPEPAPTPTPAPTQAATGTQLVFSTQPSNTVAGALISPAIRVSILDSTGAPVTTATNQITLALAAARGNGQLSGITSVTAVNGVATFDNVAISGEGEGYVLSVSSNGLSSATSAAFTVGSYVAPEQAAQADSFVNSVGVVTHMSYTDTPYYTAWPQVLTALKSLGVRHIRDGFYNWSPSSPFIAEHQALAASGITCNYVVPWDQTTTPQILEQFASEAQDMEALEAPNECDADGNCGGGGETGIRNVLAFLPTLTAAGQQLNVPVIGPSFTQQSSYAAAGNIASDMTYNNLHVYFGGRNPGSQGWGDLDADGRAYGSFNWWLDQAALDAPGVPSEITESGYMAYPTTSTPYTLPESVEASYTPRTLLLAFQHGVKRTFLYELLDEISSPGYGLLNGDFTPKPAFTAVKNLLSVLSDQGDSFSPGTLSYSLEGGDATLNHLLLQKRDGSFWLVLWLEQSSFDPASDTAEPVSAQDVTLQLYNSNSAGHILQFDKSGNVTSTQVTGNGSTLSLAVSDQVTIVQIAAQQ